MLRLGADPKKERRMIRDRLLENLRGLEEGNSKYVSASEESQRDTTVVVHPMDDQFHLSYIGALETTVFLNEVRLRYSS